MHTVSEFLASQLASMSLLLATIIVNYMDIISTVLAQHTTDNFIAMDGPCLLGHRVKKERIVRTCRFVASYYAYSYVPCYMAG